MRLNRLSLLFSIIFGLAYMSSCDETDEKLIGRNLDDQKLVNVCFTDTFEVQTDVFYYDSLRSTNTQTSIIGRIDEGELGITSADFYTQLALSDPFNGIAEVENSTYDSIAVILKLAPGAYYGDTTKSFTLVIHELAEAILDSVNNDVKSYYTNDVLELGDEIGRRTVSLPELENDTIRIFLDDAFGQKLFGLYGEPAFDSQEEFVKAINGIHIGLEDEDEGFQLGFTTWGSRTSYIQMFFHIPNTSTEEEDDISKVNSFFYMDEFTKNFNHIDYTKGSALGDLELNGITSSSNLDNKGFAFAGTGVTTRINFPQLIDLYNKYPDDVVITEAKLILYPLGPEADNGIIQPNNLQLPPPSLFFGALDNGGNIIQDEFDNAILLPNEIFSNANSAASIVYSSGTQTYSSLELTTYLQDKMVALGRGEDVSDTGLFILPFNNNSSFNKLVFGDQDNTSTHPLNGYNMGIQLEISYTTFSGESCN